MKRRVDDKASGTLDILSISDAIYVDVPTEREALAALAEDVGSALVRFAESLRTSTPDPKPAAAKTSAAARGTRQQAVLKLEGIDTDEGLTAVEVAKGVGVRQPNAYTLLESMVTKGTLEKAPDTEPAHWRVPRSKA